MRKIHHYVVGCTALLMLAACGQQNLAGTPSPVKPLDIVVVNDQTNTVTVPGNITAAPGESGSIPIYLHPTNDDGKNGCNATGGPSVPNVNVQVTSSHPGVISSGVVLDVKCGTANPATFNYAVSSSAVPGTVVTLTTSASGGASGSTYTSTNAVSKLTITIVQPNVADTTGPVITPVIVSGTLGENGWYTSDVELKWDISDPESATILTKTGCDTVIISSDTPFVGNTYTCSATSAGGTSTNSITIKRDATAPVVQPADQIETAWRNSDFINNFTASDATSGLADSNDAAFTLTASAESVDTTTPTTSSRVVKDQAGNSTTRTISAFIDKTPPTNLQFDFGSNPVINDNSSFYWGEVPAAPLGCSASDALSGLASCNVSGYASSIGQHTLTATATDNATNTAKLERKYSVLAWRTEGFFQPVDMGKAVYNTVKGGSTVPLKFRVFGSTEKTSVDAIKPLTWTKVSCQPSVPADDVTVVATGGTNLRYDTTAGQFVYNWQTPKTAGMCYTVTVTLADGSKISANFKIK
ncbi:PxKF domain-containing protein [Deinococcus yavapaiensis]|uniref:Ig-like domain-containing protein n=1 Tax=Deinococcus yavapaiensis KR-236 TaxID=694435 RepID=A0A318SMP9_9DEIO|nr:PxKF domain-containing protein [Deinococcus yavapaiensis]PYE53821.1 hypothetical protein DES52_10779 [Deinococcus yavapaiensis KR-236]